jgi:hypothetical protein
MPVKTKKAGVAAKLCNCIGAVKTRGIKGEKRAIAICVASVLQKKRQRTLKKFSCRGPKPILVTQPLKRS